MTTRSHKRLKTLALLPLLAIAGCKSSCEPSKQTSPATDPIELTGTAPTYVELTAAAAGPTGNGACKDGIVLVAAGSTDGDPQNLLMGPVQGPFPAAYDLAEWNYDTSTWDKLGTGTLPAPPTPTTDAPEGSDSQAARLANGDLLLMWNGSTKASLGSGAKPSWWSNWGPSGMPEGLLKRFPTGHRDGYRPAQVFWRYSCANGQWSSTPGMLDSGSAVVLVTDPTTKTIQSQVGYCAEFSPWVGGFDRPELFVDPWGVDPKDPSKQRILISTLCRRSTGDTIQVFTSPDSGQTWDPSGVVLEGDLPVAMTSRPLSRTTVQTRRLQRVCSTGLKLRRVRQDH